jgi:hypothetical protein
MQGRSHQLKWMDGRMGRQMGARMGVPMEEWTDGFPRGCNRPKA